MTFHVLTAVALALSVPTPELTPVAAAAREAFTTRDFTRLLEPRRSVRLALPGRPALPVIGGAAAAATLQAFTRRTEDREVTLVRSALVEARYGYIELTRIFRVLGTQQWQRDRILLSAVLDGGRWRVAEVLIVAAPEER